MLLIIEKGSLGVNN